MGPGSATEARQTMAGESALILVPTFVVVAVDATGMGIILPLLPFYSQRLGATPFLLGALISAYAVCQLVAGPVVGMLSDRYGQRKVLVVSQIDYPGWKASVDGQPVDMTRANYALPAIFVPQGEHHIVFSFEPLSFRLGLLLSAVCVSVIAIMFSSSLTPRFSRR